MANFSDGFVDIASRSNDDSIDLHQPAFARVTTNLDNLDVFAITPEATPETSQSAYNDYLEASATLASLIEEKYLAVAATDSAKAYKTRAENNLNKLDDTLALAQNRAQIDPGYQYKLSLVQVAHENASQEFAVADSAYSSALSTLDGLITDIEAARDDVEAAQQALVAPELIEAYISYPYYNKIVLFFTTPVTYIGGVVVVTDRGDEVPIRSINKVRSDAYEVVLATDLRMVDKSEIDNVLITIDASVFKNLLGNANEVVTDFPVISNLLWEMEEVLVTAPIGGKCPAWLANQVLHNSLRFSYKPTPLSGPFDSLAFGLGFQCILDTKADNDFLPDNSSLTLQPDDKGLASIHLGGQVIYGVRVIADTTINVGQACDFAQVARGAGDPEPFHVVSTELCQPLGGGGTSSPLLIGTVVGGNASSILPPGKITGIKGKENYSVPSTESATEPDELGFVDTDYPANRSYAFPLPTLNKNNQLKVLPRVNRWDRYALPSTYKMGDKLPRLPDGLCYVRLVRPYSWNGKRWDANYDQVPESDNLLMYPRAVRLKDNVLKVYYPDIEGFVKQGTFLQDPLRNVPPGSAFIINSTLKDAQGNKLVVTNYSDLVNGVVTLTLSFNPDPIDTLIGLTVVIAESVFMKKGVPATENTEAIDPVASGGNTLPIEGSGDANTIVLAMNREGLQGFKQGDYVIMRDDSLLIADHVQLAGTAGTSTGYPTGPTTGSVSKPVLTIIGSVSGGLPLHTHTNNGGGIAGGGISNLSSLV